MRHAERFSRPWLALAAGLASMVAVQACAPAPDTLTFWAMGQEGEKVGLVLEPFLKQHPEIHLKIQAIPWGAAHDKLLTAFAGQSTPDLCQLGNTWVSEFQAMKALVPLDGRLDGMKGRARQDFFPGILQSNVVAGRLYGIPWYVDTRAVFYRSDLLKQAGFAHPPGTWAELSQAARAMTHPARAGHPACYGIVLPANPGGSPIPLFFAWQNGADILDADALHGQVETAAFQEAVDYYVDFFKAGSSPREVGDQTNFYQAFAEGAFGMFISGPWEVQGLREKMPGLTGKWAVAPMPAKLAGGKRSSSAGGSSLVIFKSSRHQAQAWALISYLSEPSVQADFYGVTADLPARRSAWADPRLAHDAAVRAFYDQLRDAHPAPPIPEWEQIADKLGGWVEQAVYGKATTRAAMAGLQGDIEGILSKRRYLKSREAQR